MVGSYVTCRKSCRFLSLPIVTSCMYAVIVLVKIPFSSGYHDNGHFCCVSAVSRLGVTPDVVVGIHRYSRCCETVVCYVVSKYIRRYPWNCDVLWQCSLP